MNYKKTTLQNGVRLITVPTKGTKTATVMVMVGVGSRHESDTEAGLSHFIEHMLFKGTEKRPTAMDIAEELDSIGGEFNAFTSKDRTAYYAKVDSKHLPVALDVIFDIFKNSKIESAEIKKEKGAILQEISMYEDLPSRKVWDVFESLLYRGNSLAREIIGSKKTVSSFSRKEFIDYMEKYYVGSDTIICVAGKIKEKEVIENIKEHFVGIKKGRKASIEKVVEDQKKPSFSLKYKQTDQTHLVVGFRSYDQNHKDRFVLSVISAILGGNMSSRLFNEVREKRGLAYFIRTTVGSFEDCGYFSAQAGVKHAKLGESLEVILSEFSKMSKEKVSSRELKKAKDYIKGKGVMNLESSDEVASFCIDQELDRGSIMSVEEIFKKIEKVSEDDILRVSKDIFQDSKLNLAVIGPHKNRKELSKSLKLSV